MGLFRKRKVVNPVFQMQVDEFNQRYLKACETSQPEDWFQACLSGRRLVDTGASLGLFNDILPELQRLEKHYD